MPRRSGRSCLRKRAILRRDKLLCHTCSTHQSFHWKPRASRMKDCRAFARLGGWGHPPLRGQLGIKAFLTNSVAVAALRTISYKWNCPESYRDNHG